MSYQRRYEIIVGAVKFAMLIDVAEDSVRQLMKNAEQEELRNKNAKFVTEGFVGHSGPQFLGFGRTTTLPK
jgi:hypothetical protein